jgi:multiple sugar transport system permease protein
VNGLNTDLILKHSTVYKVLFRIRRILLGSTINDGLIFRTVVYALLVSIGFVYLYPILYMLSQSLKSLPDLLDPTVIWIPKQLFFDNFVRAWKVLDFPKSLAASLLNSILPALAQTVSCALVGYGFAKFRFPGKNLLFGFMLLTFIIPNQVVMIPLFLLFQKYGMLGTPLPFIVPALFAGGLKSAVFILIYTQFFKTIPDALEESAQLDGAGYANIFFRIILPISVPAIVVVFLFSLVWHWNETYTASLYLGNSMRTLPLKLQTFNDSFNQLYSSTDTGGREANINESIKMAGTMLIVLPLLILYAFMQKWFVEVIDKTGITGE